MRESGFTLLETFIVIGISLIALVGLVNLFLMFNSTYGYEQTFTKTAGSASATMDALENAVLPAERVLASHNFDGTTYSSATTTLVLELPAVDVSGNIIAGTKDYVAFYPSGTQLYRLVSLGAGSVRTPGRTQLTAALSSLSFTYDSPDFAEVTSVTVDLTTRSQFKQQTAESRLKEQMYLRNFQNL